MDVSDTGVKMDIFEDLSLIFAPQELQTIVLTNVSSGPNKHILDSNHKDANSELNHVINKKIADISFSCGFKYLGSGGFVGII